MAAVTDPTTITLARRDSIITPEINPVKSQIVKLIADIHEAEETYANQIPSSFYAKLSARVTPLMLQTDPELADSQVLMQRALDVAKTLVKQEDAPEKKEAAPHVDIQKTAASETKAAEKPSHCIRDTALIVGALAVTAAVIVTPQCRVQ